MGNLIRRTRGERVFSACNYMLMAIFGISILFPFIHLLAISFSTSTEAARFGLHLIPKHVSTEAYRKVFSSEFIYIGYMNTIIRALFGTILSLFLTAFGGYVLSKKYIPHRSFWTIFIVFTMFFSGGLIPTFLLVRDLRLLDSRLALILPGAIQAFHLLIMRNYFMTIPTSLEDSARMDGASDLRILLSIYMPVAKPMLATVALWLVVGHWNAWFDCLIYIRNVDKFVLQIVLRRIVLEGTQEMLDMNTGIDDAGSSSPDTVKAAAIYVATLPILMVYPFIQKHFVKGIMIGSLKG